MPDPIRERTTCNVCHRPLYVGGPDRRCLCNGTTLRDRIEALEAALRTKVAMFLCPVHGSALCPEDYMLYADGQVKHGYHDAWSGGKARCGQRPTVESILAARDA